MRSATSRWNISISEFIPGRPWFDREPAHKESCRDIVRQVCYDAGPFRTQLLKEIDGKSVACHDIEPSRITSGDFLQRSYRTLIPFDSDDAAGAERE